MKMISPAIRLLFICLAVCCINLPLSAQHLPQVQESRMHAPSNIKIDGKADEWGDKFKAYNKTTGIYYTMANDDDHLYIIIQSTDAGMTRKIVQGGITLTVNITGKKNDANNPAITFPKYDNLRLNGPAINGGVVHTLPGRDDVLVYTATDGTLYGLGHTIPHDMDLVYPTDFWAQYTLIKK